MTNPEQAHAEKKHAEAVELLKEAEAAQIAAYEALKPHLVNGAIDTETYKAHRGLVKAQDAAVANRKRAMARVARWAKKAGIETPTVRYRRRMREIREAREQRLTYHINWLAGRA